MAAESGSLVAAASLEKNQLSCVSTAASQVAVSSYCDFKHTLDVLRQSLVFTGIASGFAAYIGIIAAYRRVRREKNLYVKYLRRIDYRIGDEPWVPRLTGKKFTSFLGMLSGLFVPLLIGAAWYWIGRKWINEILGDSLSEGMLLFAVLLMLFISGIYSTRPSDNQGVVR